VSQMFLFGYFIIFIFYLIMKIRKELLKVYARDLNSQEVDCNEIDVSCYIDMDIHDFSTLCDHVGDMQNLQSTINRALDGLRIDQSTLNSKVTLLNNKKGRTNGTEKVLTLEKEIATTNHRRNTLTYLRNFIDGKVPATPSLSATWNGDGMGALSAKATLELTDAITPEMVDAISYRYLTGDIEMFNIAFPRYHNVSTWFDAIVGAIRRVGRVTRRRSDGSLFLERNVVIQCPNPIVANAILQVATCFDNKSRELMIQTIVRQHKNLLQGRVFHLRRILEKVRIDHRPF
jgi:hypothetical protein